MNGFKLLESYVKISEQGFAAVNQKISQIRAAVARIPNSKTIAINSTGLSATLSDLNSLRSAASSPIKINVDTTAAKDKIRDLDSSFEQLAALGGSKLGKFIEDATVIPDVSGLDRFRSTMDGIGSTLTRTGTRFSTLVPKLSGLIGRFGSLASASSLAATPLGAVLSVFGGIGVAARVVFSSLTAVFGVLVRIGSTALSTALAVINPILSAIRATFTAVVSIVGRIVSIVGGTLLNALSSVAGLVGRIVALTGGLLVTATVIGGLVGGLREINNIQIESRALQSLLKDAELTKQLFNDFTQIGERFGDVAGFRRAGRVLLALGSDTAQVREELLRINDIAAGTGNRFEDVSSIYTQIRTKNQLYAEEIQQLGDRGIPIVQELSRVLGVNQRQVRSLAEQGKIDFAQFLTAFNSLTNPGGKFFEAAITQSEALLNQIGRIRSTLTLAAGTALTAFSDVFAGIVQQGRILANVATQVANRFAETQVSGAFLDGAVKRVTLGLALAVDFTTNLVNAVVNLAGQLPTVEQGFAAIGQIGAQVWNVTREQIINVVAAMDAILIQSRLLFANISRYVEPWILIGKLVARVVVLTARWSAALALASNNVRQVRTILQSITGDFVDQAQRDFARFGADFENAVKGRDADIAVLEAKLKSGISNAADSLRTRFQGAVEEFQTLLKPGEAVKFVNTLVFEASETAQGLLARGAGITAENTAAVQALTAAIKVPDGVRVGSNEFSSIQAQQLTNQLVGSQLQREEMKRQTAEQKKTNALQAKNIAAVSAAGERVAAAVEASQVTIPVASIQN